MILDDDIDVSLGDLNVKINNQPEQKREFAVMLCWLNDEAMKPRTKIITNHISKEERAMVKEVVYKINIHSFERDTEVRSIKMNDFDRVRIRTTRS